MTTYRQQWQTSLSAEKKGITMITDISLEYVSAWHDTDKDSAVLTFADVKTGLDEDLKTCYKLGDTTIIEYK